LEELRKQLELLTVFRRHPTLVAENTALRQRLADATRELAALTTVERVVGDTALTLPQLAQRVRTTQAEELERRAQQRFDDYTAQWERREKPREVQRAVRERLATLLDLYRRPPPRYFPSDMIDQGLPDTIHAICAAEVESRLNQAFQTRVEAEATRRAAASLDALTRDAWPGWVAAHVDPKLAVLADQARTNALRMLQGPWTFRCPTCGHPVDYAADSAGIARLLSARSHVSPCPRCRRGVTITLQALIRAALDLDGPPSRREVPSTSSPGLDLEPDGGTWST
jgi:hypothetical protein